MDSNPHAITDANQFAKLVLEEFYKATGKHGAFNNLHEAYAVILEEVDELWDETKKKPQVRDYENIKLELIQIAAMCMRAAVDLKVL